MLREGLTLTALGLMLGFVLSVLLANAARALLVGVSPIDPFTYVAVLLTLVIVSMVACYVPARRAARLDPAHALKED